VISCYGVAAAETRVSVAAGVEYSTGDYGEPADTEVTAAPLSVRFTTGDWAFRAAVSYLSITGPADFATVTEGGGTSSVARMGTEEGFGDTTLPVTRSLYPFENHDHYLDLTGRVRLPTGDEDKGLGVGATDYIAAAELGTSNKKGGAYVSAG